MTRPALQPIHVGQIWQNKRTGRQVRIATHNVGHGVARLDPLDGRRGRHAMEITLRRNYDLVKDADQ